MANKKTIHEINIELDGLHKRLTRTLRRIDDLRELRRKIQMGKIKQPAPKGVKVMLKTARAPRDEFDDALPSFGSGAGFGQ